jgi:hypothetical protein
MPQIQTEIQIDAPADLIWDVSLFNARMRSQTENGFDVMDVALKQRCEAIWARRS